MSEYNFLIAISSAQSRMTKGGSDFLHCNFGRALDTFVL